MSYPYVLDATALIDAHRRWYPSDVFAGYWDWLFWHHDNGYICSIDKVRGDIERGSKDALQEMVKTRMPSTWFRSTNQDAVVEMYRELQVWAHSFSNSSGQGFTDNARNVFAQEDESDSWLCAFAKVNGCVLVTDEGDHPNSTGRIYIPTVCRVFGVEYLSTCAMLRELGAKFDWTRQQG